MSISQTLCPTASRSRKRRDQTMTAGETRPAELETPVRLRCRRRKRAGTREGVGRAEGEYGATVGETGSGHPGSATVPRARASDSDLARELPYRPAAVRRRIGGRTDGSIRPRAMTGLKVSLAQTGASTDVAWVGEVDALIPAPIGVQAMRTEFGRPNSSMRLRTWTATSTSVAWRSSVCERSPSPITCLKRDIPVSALARLV